MPRGTSHDVLMTWPYISNKMAAMLREMPALPSCTLCDDVSHCLGMIISMNSVDVCVHCFIMTPFGSQVTRTSCTVVCFYGNTKEGDKPQRSVPKYTIWLRTDMSYMRIVIGLGKLLSNDVAMKNR